MKAIILAAGQGRRLLPITADLPKCLLDIGDGRTVLEHALEALERTGSIEDVLVVVGYRAGLIEEHVKTAPTRLRVQCVYNPFFADTNALVSLWLALQQKPAAFVVINGDLVFSPEALRQLLQVPRKHEIAVLYSRRDAYSRDAVKLIARTGRLVRIGKEVASDEATGESPGIVRFVGEGARRAADVIEAQMREPEGRHALWHSSLERLIASGVAIHLEQCRSRLWTELDQPRDVELVRRRNGALSAVS